MMQKQFRVVLCGILSVVMTLASGAVGQASGAPPRADKNWPSPFVAIVWPHNGSGVYTPVANSKAVNISMWPTSSVSCATAPDQTPALLQARNNEPAAPVDKKPEFFVRSQSGVKFPSMEFNNISADMASDPTNRYYFMPGGWQGNVWVDATDARTYLPNPLQPVGFSDKALPAQIDARIQIVYPHDRQGNLASLDKATLDNVAVDLFERGTRKSVPLDYKGGPIVLYIAEANFAMGLAQADTGTTTVVASASLEPYKVGTVTYPRWVFNNVKVQPGKQYHFLVRVKGVETFPTIWTHSKDVRTYLPNPSTPPACSPDDSTPPPSPTPCSSAWFTSLAVPGSCPTTASQQVDAAYEPFEHGVMLWRKDTGFDILRFNTGQWEGWQNDLTICRDTSASVTAPAGLFAPVSGFGYIWRGDADYCTYSNPQDFDHKRIRKNLGWATATESGYTATVQSGERVERQGYTPVLYTYITLPDGRLVELSRSAAPNQSTYFRILNP